jgi:regulator of replication initiation timing
MFSSQSRPNADQQKLYQEIKFLQLENQKLKEELSDAKDMIKMNKF